MNNEVEGFLDAFVELTHPDKDGGSFIISETIFTEKGVFVKYFDKEKNIIYQSPVFATHGYIQRLWRMIQFAQDVMEKQNEAKSKKTT